MTTRRPDGSNVGPCHFPSGIRVSADRKQRRVTCGFLREPESAVVQTRATGFNFHDTWDCF